MPVSGSRPNGAVLTGGGLGLGAQRREVGGQASGECVRTVALANVRPVESDAVFCDFVNTVLLYSSSWKSEAVCGLQGCRWCQVIQQAPS